MGSLHPNIAPYGDVFFTKDKKPVVLAVGTEKQFQLLCGVLNLQKLKKDKRFRINALRVKNREELKEELTPAVAQFQRDDLLQQLKHEGAVSYTHLTLPTICSV